jgi:hypothetical protein
MGGVAMKVKLLRLLECMALFAMASVGAANADTFVEFTAAGMFSDGTTLTGTMSVDVSGVGCVGGSAGCPDTVAPSFSISTHPGETFILGANPGFVGLFTDSLPLISSPFCCGDLSMQILFQTPDAGDLNGYAGGLITGGQTVVDCGTNGTCNLDSGLSGSFIPAAVPEPSTWAMLLLGFAGIGLVAYRRKTKASSAARVNFTHEFET